MCITNEDELTSSLVNTLFFLSNGFMLATSWNTSSHVHVGVSYSLFETGIRLLPGTTFLQALWLVGTAIYPGC
jgi:hypothetical protein